MINFASVDNIYFVLFKAVSCFLNHNEFLGKACRACGRFAVGCLVPYSEFN